MAKAKLLKKLIQAEGGLAKQVRLRLPRSNLDITYQRRRKDMAIMKKPTPTNPQTDFQLEQRTLYCDCDLLYKLIKYRFFWILDNWYDGLEAKEKKGLTPNTTFMKFCLSRDLESFLSRYFKLGIKPLIIRYVGNYVEISTNLYQMSEEEYLESFYEPLRPKF